VGSPACALAAVRQPPSAFNARDSLKIAPIGWTEAPLRADTWV
jgi:hypothetical protein